MSKLTIMRGLAGSGKSTKARSYPGAVVVSRDDLRLALFGSDGQDYYKVDKSVLKQREDFITKVEQAAIRDGLRAGNHVVSDNTNIEPKYMKPFIKIAHSVGATVEIDVVDVPLNVALARNLARGAQGGRFVPEDVIRKQHDRFQQTKDAVVELPALPEVYTGTPGKPAAFLFDIDGTTFHMNGKRHFAAHNVDVDDADEIVCDVVWRLQDSGLLAIGMSGREQATRELTVKALENEGITPARLFMRETGDNRSDNIVKAELFDEHVRDNFDVKFVIDDRWQVCEMWLTMGLKVFNVSGLDRGEF
jgi:predicted kinase